LPFWLRSLSREPNWRESSGPAAVRQSASPADAQAAGSDKHGSPAVRLALSLVSLNLEALGIVRPETVVRWHRLGFRAYWRWRSRSRVGRPTASTQLRTLIRQISRANPLWGALRIRGEPLNWTSTSPSPPWPSTCRRGPLSQGWKTFLRNHAPDIGAIDLFVVPTAG
jgi:hypothetical protein